jgi:hypothetical protein
VIIGVYFYYKSKKEKTPTYFITSKRLIKDFLSEYQSLKVIYNDNPISNLTVSNITFWNDGKEVIDGTDITKAEPLIIKIREGNAFLDAKVIYRSTPANQFDVEYLHKQGIVLMKFDYLGFEDGAVIQILHDASSSNDIEICGTIKGFGSICTDKKNHQVVKRAFQRAISKVLFSSKRRRLGYGLIISVCLLWLASLVTWIRPEVLNLNIAANKILDGRELPFIAVMGSIMYLPIAYYILKRNVPKKFQLFEEKF